jgi:hypothetical protein
VDVNVETFAAEASDCSMNAIMLLHVNLLTTEECGKMPLNAGRNMIPDVNQ